jgi:hypothetical protein
MMTFRYKNNDPTPDYSNRLFIFEDNLNSSDDETSGHGYTYK